MRAAVLALTLAAVLGLAAASVDFSFCPAGSSTGNLNAIGDVFGCDGYDNLVTKSWIVNFVGPIELNAISFNTEFSWDYVRIYRNGVGVAGFSGSMNVPFVFYSMAPGQYKIEFTSDSSVTAPGFKISLAPASIDPNCQIIGGTQISDSGNQYCYRVFASDNSVNAIEAEAACQAWSPASHLATVPSAAVNEYLSNAIDALSGSLNNFWIGANDIAVEGTFVNRDGSPFGYSNWAPGEPNNFPVDGFPDREDCTVGNWNGGNFRDMKWNDYPCGGKYTRYFACSVLSDALIPGGNVAPCSCSATAVSDPGTSVSLSFSTSGQTIFC